MTADESTLVQILNAGMDAMREELEAQGIEVADMVLATAAKIDGEDQAGLCAWPKGAIGTHAQLLLEALLMISQDNPEVSVMAVPADEVDPGFLGGLLNVPPKDLL